jgi:hypothetical protein
MHRLKRQRLRLSPFFALLLAALWYGGSSSGSVSSHANQVPVITLSTIQGYTAEISNYSYSGGIFCFTLTNNSPLALIAMGADLGVRTPVSISSQIGGPIPPFHVDAFIEGTEFNNKLNGTQLSFVLSSPGGLDPGESATLCLNLTTDFSAEYIAHHFFVTFFPKLQLDCGDPFQFPEKRLLIQFVRLTDVQECLVFTNLSNEVMTGIEFDLAGNRGPFDLLSITPSRQPFNQHLRFSRNPATIPEYPQLHPDFAVLTGGQFARGISPIGVQPGETSSEFCIGGNFAGLTPDDIIARVYVRTQNLTRQCINIGPPVGGGQTGLLGGSPR